MKNIFLLFLLSCGPLVRSAHVDIKKNKQDFENHPQAIEIESLEKEHVESFQVDIQFKTVSKNQIVNYKYELSFSFDTEHIYINRDLFLSDEKTSSTLKFKIKSLPNMSQEQRSLISINAKGKDAGLLFLSRKAQDPLNFFGLSYPKEIGYFKNKWGWIGITIEDNNIVRHQDSQNNLIPFTRVEIPDDKDFLLYKKKFGFKKIPLGIKKYTIY